MNSEDRNKRIYEIQRYRESLHRTERYIALEAVDVDFMLSELSRLQVERDKAIEVLQGYSITGLEGAKRVLSELGVSHDPLD